MLKFEVSTAYFIVMAQWDFLEVTPAIKAAEGWSVVRKFEHAHTSSSCLHQGLVTIC